MLWDTVEIPGTLSPILGTTEGFQCCVWESQGFLNDRAMCGKQWQSILEISSTSVLGQGSVRNTNVGSPGEGVGSRVWDLGRREKDEGVVGGSGVYIEGEGEGGRCRTEGVVWGEEEEGRHSIIRDMGSMVWPHCKSLNGNIPAAVSEDQKDTETIYTIMYMYTVLLCSGRTL